MGSLAYRVLLGRNLIWEAELKGTVIREVVMPWLLMIVLLLSC